LLGRKTDALKKVGKSHIGSKCVESGFNLKINYAGRPVLKPLFKPLKHPICILEGGVNKCEIERVDRRFLCMALQLFQQPLSFITISRGTFNKALGFAGLYESFIPLVIAIPVLIGLSAAFLKKQEA
jgi:hypothetical protein